jgi:integrase
LAEHDYEVSCECGAQWRVRLEPGELVFTSPNGATIRASLFRRRFWQPACIDAGLGEIVTDDAGKKHYEGLRVHDLRHSAVALWIAAGASPKEIAVRAGHTSVSTVLDRYGHLLPGHEDKVNDALDVMAEQAHAVTPGRVVNLR